MCPCLIPVCSSPTSPKCICAPEKIEARGAEAGTGCLKTALGSVADDRSAEAYRTLG
jgi:hypothetical protein